MVQDKKTYKNIFYAVESRGNEYWYSWVPKNTFKEAKELYRKEIESAKNNSEYGPFAITMYRIDKKSNKAIIIKAKGVR